MWSRRRMYYVGDDEGMIYRLYHSFYFSSKISCGSQHNAFDSLTTYSTCALFISFLRCSYCFLLIFYNVLSESFISYKYRHKKDSEGIYFSLTLRSLLSSVHTSSHNFSSFLYIFSISFRIWTHFAHIFLLQ